MTPIKKSDDGISAKGFFILLFITFIVVASVAAGLLLREPTSKVDKSLYDLQYKCVMNTTMQMNETYFVKAWEQGAVTIARCDTALVNTTNAGNCYVVQQCLVN